MVWILYRKVFNSKRAKIGLIVDLFYHPFSMKRPKPNPEIHSTKSQVIAVFLFAYCRICANSTHWIMQYPSPHKLTFSNNSIIAKSELIHFFYKLKLEFSVFVRFMSHHMFNIHHFMEANKKLCHSFSI